MSVVTCDDNSRLRRGCGHAPGQAEPAMAAAMRVSGADTRYGLWEAPLGLIPGAAGTQRRPRLVG